MSGVGIPGLKEETPSNRRLLITEDDAALRQMLRWEFEELGYHVIETGSCREAEHAAKTERPQIALLDFHLPDGDGALLLQRLQLLLPGLPVVLYSGRVPAAAVQACGAARFLCKPVSAKRLHGIFSELLSGAPSRPPANLN
ncbi:MAG: response regulator [Gammaproteobacteria bacterium]|nr:response regulator [Gammaproteobacteria bacterium]